METVNESSSAEKHMLYDKWVFWAHLPHDTSWSIDSYIQIASLDNLEDTINLANVMPDAVVKNCMLFVMRKGINPMWEDEKNRSGGCFSFKVSNKDVLHVWKNLYYSLVGETISNDMKFIQKVNGITISPKKAFYIIKIWMSTTENQNPNKIIDINGLSLNGCLFKRHLTK